MAILWPQAISCRHWPSWPIPTSPTPRPSSLILGLGVILSSRGPPGPLAIILGFRATPSIIGVLAFLGHLGPLKLLWPVGHLGPFWPNPMRPKGASQVVPKPQLDPPEPFLAITSLDPKVTKNLMDTILAINPIGPNFGHGPPWINSSAMASGNHQRPPDQLSPSFPSTPGSFFFSFIPSVLKVAGMVHILYYIPLCTIFAQQSNGEVFRTQFHLFNSRSQIPTHISKED
ncbi:hypothetical protein O181_125367 [Austropuccinia psidii MF-1]|uniref:Uncharacterized protein n=1 Tax=Austropuccinia psidii MF-1 TaxID=1389203 RepID=A0A9Q3Q7D9_9BASI|nr:hypothetical protein [Austropuccinia psidii MF-1]